MPQHSSSERLKKLYIEVEWPLEGDDKILLLQRFLLAYLMEYRKKNLVVAQTAVRYYILGDTQRRFERPDASFYNNLNRVREAMASTVAMLDLDQLEIYSRFYQGYTDEELANIILQNLPDPIEDKHARTY